MRRPFTSLALLLSLPALSQQAAPAQDGTVIDKFGVIAPQLVIGQSGHFRKLYSELDLHRKQWDERFAAKNGELQQLQKQLQASGLSDEGKDRIEKQLRDLELDAKKMQEDAKADMEKTQQRFEKAFNQDLSPVIEQMAKEKGLKAVIQYQPGLFAFLDDSAGGLSEEAAKRVDAKFPQDANFQLPGAAAPQGGAPKPAAPKPAVKPAIKK